MQSNTIAEGILKYIGLVDKLRKAEDNERKLEAEALAQREKANAFVGEVDERAKLYSTAAWATAQFHIARDARRRTGKKTESGWEEIVERLIEVAKKHEGE